MEPQDASTEVAAAVPSMKSPDRSQDIAWMNAQQAYLAALNNLMIRRRRGQPEALAVTP